MKKIIVALGVAFVFTSCNGKGKYKRELQQIDSLQAVVTELDHRLDSLDGGKVTTLSTHVDSQYQTILDNYPDSADREFWLNQVGYFGHIRKSLNRYEENAKDMNEELAYTQSQLEELQNSVEDDKLKPEEVQKYLQDEGAAVQMLEMRTRKVVPETWRAFTLWDSLQPRYDSIANYVRGLP